MSTYRARLELEINIKARNLESARDKIVNYLKKFTEAEGTVNFTDIQKEGKDEA